MNASTVWMQTKYSYTMRLATIHVSKYLMNTSY